MPIDRTNTDFRRLEDGMREAITHRDLHDFEVRVKEILKALTAMQERHGTAITELTMDVRDLKQRQQLDAGSFVRLKEKFTAFVESTNERLLSIKEWRDKQKYMLSAASAAATAIGFVLVKALDYWLAHK